MCIWWKGGLFINIPISDFNIELSENFILTITFTWSLVWLLVKGFNTSELSLISFGVVVLR